MFLTGIFARRAWRPALTAMVMAMVMALFMALVAANSRTVDAAEQDPIAATVDGEPITRTELLLALEFLPAQFRNLPAEQLFPLIREQLIDIKLLAKKGAEAGLADDPRVVARREFYAMRMIYDYYAADIVASYMTEDFLHESYEIFLENFPATEELKISHILVATEEEAERVVAVLDDGEDFATAARNYSVGPSAPKGGELGFIRREQVVPEFGDVAFSLEDGEVSDPVKTQFGWHIIRIAERRTLQPPSYAEMETRLRTEITDRLVSEAAAEARHTAEIELFDLDEDFFDGLTAAP